MKKILIIDLFSFQYLGGGQKYTRELVKILDKLNFDITIISFWNNERKNTKFINPKIKQFFIFKEKKEYKNIIINNINSLWNYIYAKKYLKNFLNNNEFSIIIDNCTCVAIGKKYRNKAIFIQHHDEKILFNKCRYIIQNIFFIKPVFYYHCLNVVFTKNNKDIFCKKTSNLNVEIIPLFITNNIEQTKKSESNMYINNITYIGRTDTRQKKLNFLCDISVLLNEKIHIIGNKSNALDLMKDKIIYDGEKTNDEIINNILPYVKCIILTSNSEGLPFIVLEAFSVGKPVIVRDTFTNAKYLVTKERGLLIDKYMEPKDIAKIIDNIDWNSFNSENIRNFVMNEFSYTNFENSWINILNKF